MNIGERIKEQRKKHGLTQEQLALRSGISKNAIWNYENEKREPSIDIIIKIAASLDVPVAKIIGLENLYYADMYSRHLQIYNLLLSYKTELSNNFIKLFGSIKHVNENFASEAMNKLLKYLFDKINFDIFDIIGSVIYENIRNKSDESVSIDLIKNEIQNSFDDIKYKISELIDFQLSAENMLTYRPIPPNFLQDDYVDEDDLNLKDMDINKELSKTLISSLTPLVIQDLISDISFKILEDNYFDLNEDGKNKAYEYVSDLAEQPKYGKDA